MDKRTLAFYKLTKLTDIFNGKSSHLPITYIKVFHKDYPRLRSIKLPKSKQRGELMNLLNTRLSSRLFSNVPLTISQLSRVFDGCRITFTDNYFERRTYPSGGDRFPVELYLVAFNVKGLDTGVYHYNIVNNTLEVLLNEDMERYRYYLVSHDLHNAAAAIILTSVMSRSEVKYGVKSYPLSLIETGAIMQNLQLLSVKNDIGLCPIAGFVNDKVSEILDLTQDEIPLLVLGLGNIQ